MPGDIRQPKIPPTEVFDQTRNREAQDSHIHLEAASISGIVAVFPCTVAGSIGLLPAPALDVFANGLDRARFTPRSQRVEKTLVIADGRFARPGHRCFDPVVHPGQPELQLMPQGCPARLQARMTRSLHDEMVELDVEQRKFQQTRGGPRVFDILGDLTSCRFRSNFGRPVAPPLSPASGAS